MNFFRFLKRARQSPLLFGGVFLLLSLFVPDVARAQLLDIAGIGIGAVKEALAGLVHLIFLLLTNTILPLAGYFFDYAAGFSIVNMGQAARAGGFVENGWKVVRDLVNVTFIFILLYIAIATVLRVKSIDMKRLVFVVVAVALFINFSLAITQVVIDGANILAAEFYNKVNNVVDRSTGTVSTLSISEVILAALSPTKLFEVEEQAGWVEGFAASNDDTTLIQIMASSVLGIILILALSFMLAAAGVLFTFRTAILWLLMILAPAAFVAYILPSTKSYFSKWLHQLLNQAFFAPFYMFFFYLTVKIIAETDILGTTRGENQVSGIGLGSPDGATIGLVFKYVIILILLGVCLTVAKSMGAVGANAAAGYYQKGKGWLQKKATLASGKIPGGASRAIDRYGGERLREFAAKSPRLGGAVLRTIQSGKQLGVDEAKVKRRLETAKTLTPTQQAEYFARLGRAPLARGAAAVGVTSLAAVANFFGRDTVTRERMLGEMNPRARNLVWEGAKSPGREKDKRDLESMLLQKDVWDKLTNSEKTSYLEGASPANREKFSGRLFTPGELEKFSPSERDKVKDNVETLKKTDAEAGEKIAKAFENVMRNSDLFRKLSNKEKIEVFTGAKDKGDQDRLMNLLLERDSFEKFSARDKVDVGELATATGAAYGTAFQSALTRLTQGDRDQFDREKREVGRLKQIADFITTDAKKAGALKLKDPDTQAAFQNVRPQDIERLNTALFENADNLDEMMSVLKAGHMAKMMDRSDEGSEEFFRAMSNLGGNIDEIADNLQRRGNASLAGWARTPLGRSNLEAYLTAKGVTVPPGAIIGGSFPRRPPASSPSPGSPPLTPPAPPGGGGP